MKILFSAIPDDIMKLPVPISSRTPFLCQLDVFCKQADTDTTAALNYYKRSLGRPVLRTPQSHLGQHMFIDIQLAQSTDSAGMANTPLMQLFPKIVKHFELTYVTGDTFTLDYKGIQNTVSMDEVTFTLGHARGIDGTDHGCSMQARKTPGRITEQTEKNGIQIPNYCTHEGKTDRNVLWVSAELQYRTY